MIVAPVVTRSRTIPMHLSGRQWPELAHWQRRGSSDHYYDSSRPRSRSSPPAGQVTSFRVGRGPPAGPCGPSKRRSTATGGGSRPDGGAQSRPGPRADSSGSGGRRRGWRVSVPWRRPRPRWRLEPRLELGAQARGLSETTLAPPPRVLTASGGPGTASGSASGRAGRHAH